MAWSVRRPNPVFSEEYELLRQTLIEHRRASGLTQRELAKRIGKVASHVSMIENGQRRLDTLELYLMALALDVQPEALFGAMCVRLRDHARGSSQHMSESHLDIADVT